MKLSQEKLGEMASFHRTYVSQVERRITNISIDRLEALARLLGVEAIDLMKPPPPEEEQEI
jgi:transcriptional regulator with XRE-family HTH domain